MVFQSHDAVPCVYDKRRVRIRSTSACPNPSLDGRIEDRAAGARAVGARSRKSLTQSGCRYPAASKRAVHRGTVATAYEVILLDEPCSALDPISTAKIEELIEEVSADLHDRDQEHNMQQERLGIHRVHVSGRAGGIRPTEKIFTAPGQEAHRAVHHGASARARTGKGTPVFR